MVEKLDNTLIKAKIFATNKLADFKKKVAGDETLVIKIMLMVIAVVLIILFRDTLTDIITDLLTGPGGLQEKIKALYDGK